MQSNSMMRFIARLDARGVTEISGSDTDEKCSRCCSHYTNPFDHVVGVQRDGDTRMNASMITCDTEGIVRDGHKAKVSCLALQAALCSCRLIRCPSHRPEQCEHDDDMSHD
jgi:hypothetical protein